MAINPFSILDTRTSEWQTRKKWWLNQHNIQSELGREDTVSKTQFWDTKSNVSIFDPVLCEMMYTWFCPPNGNVLDPFAGGSVRGIVAEELGFKYTGIDLSEKQIKANRLQSDKPNWIIGDSQQLLRTLKPEYDFVFTCPPYHDLEIYSDDKNDISNMSYSAFLYDLEQIISESEQRLKENRFFGIVVSEIRELTTTRDYKIGSYKNFVSNVVRMCERKGLSFYNDMVLFNSQSNAARTLKTYFDRNRKVSSVHQNVLIFVKGNPDLATEDITWDGTYKCVVKGTHYKSFREASIDINPNELGASEVERRCKSTKSKYRYWQIIGEETTPTIKYMVSGIPFESVQQIHDITELSETKINTYINSTNPLYRNWERVSKFDITYDEMLKLHWRGVPHFRLPIIQCDDYRFYSLKEAGKHFNVSDERIRQKLNDSKFPTYKYLYK
jgi:DNA modification methylase